MQQFESDANSQINYFVRELFLGFFFVFDIVVTCGKFREKKFTAPDILHKN